MTLIREILDYCERTGASETRFGRIAVNDPHLVRDLRKGRSCGPAREATVRRVMAAHPHGLPGARPRPERAGAFGRPDADDPGIVDTRRSVEAMAARTGSHALLAALCRLGLRMGGLPGLDEATFRARCIEVGLLNPRRRA
ncbi:hypothetical protein [Sphingomonas sp. SRS2]|uniref:hypothetical protein n=1 Tax=Sphingomonas sp. SRS2 TaxID=133190 RepID=UPI00061847F1|nr:hypothetical protein [Sphingomonas sp. SRS2]KKC24918.1 hypothetical protein WP12_16990 [Sphingomonas sp. SRS2]